MQVKALISDGTEQEVPWTDLTIEGYNKNQRGEQTLKLSYKEAFTQLTVTVLKKDAGTITVSLTLLGDLSLIHILHYIIYVERTER